MGKWLKLGILGIVVFIVLVCVFLFAFRPEIAAGLLGGAQREFEAPQYNSIELEPYFVTQFFDENPDYVIPGGGKTADAGKEMGEMDAFELGFSEGTVVELSESGFPSSGLALGESTPLVLSNNSGKVRSFIVVSPALDGASFSISEFAVAAGDKVVLKLFVGSYLWDIIGTSGFKPETTDKGLFVFEIVCVVNCDEGSSSLVIYAK